MENLVNTLKVEKAKLLLLFLLIIVTSCAGLSLYFFSDNNEVGVSSGELAKKLKLYWFIPDGFRSDPVVFNIYKWADNGELPNIKKMMANGTYGFSRPVFPGHTPTNFATLLTGSTPKVHGIADGPMHIEGYPLKMVSKGGFSSVAKKVPPIWYTLEERNHHVTLLSMPGSTPPELDLGVTVRGRWGGWGVDFPAMIFHSDKDKDLRHYQGLGHRVFNFGSELTKFVKSTTPSDWQLQLPTSYSPARELVMNNWGLTINGYIYDSIDDGKTLYDSVLFSEDKKTVLGDLSEGKWSEWQKVKLFWEVQNDYNIATPKKMSWERALSSVPVETHVKINVIKLGEPEFFRIRFLYNNLNNYLVKPSSLAEELNETMEPMVDFVDNYPPQLIYFKEDKKTFLDEAGMSLKWHKTMAKYSINNFETDVIIHDTYTPNQMLTSRWWLGYLDPKSPRYNDVDEDERLKLWQEVKQMYQEIDAIIGEILENTDENTYVVLSSDHGAVPLDKEVRLNNLFARHGLLFYKIDEVTGEYQIDWKKTKVIYLKMDNIYINPKGLEGNYYRTSGADYEELRNIVIKILKELKDNDGVNPVAKIVKWEDAEKVLSLPEDRVGDLVVANKSTYGWIEDISRDLEIFKPSLKSGYKQAILPEEEDGLLTPFIIVGPNVKKNHRLSKVINHIEQYPTLMQCLGQEIPSFVEGKPIQELFK